MSGVEDYVPLISARLEERLGSTAFATYLNDVKIEIDDLDRCVKFLIGSRFRAHHVAEKYAPDLERIIGDILDGGFRVDVEAYDASSELTKADVDRLEEQYSFFAPALTDMPLKDDVHLMGIAPFTLQPRGETRTRLSYRNIEGMDIDIKAHPDYGLPTATDYDIVTMMESNLAARANMYRTALRYYEAQRAVGKRVDKPEPPDRKFRPTLRQIQEFVGDHDPGLGKRGGGKQASMLEQRLDRLKNTTTKVRQTGQKRRRVGTFSYISDYRILSETTLATSSRWKSISRPGSTKASLKSPKPTILTFDDGYKTLKQPMMKFLYRLLRLTVKDEAKAFGLEDLHRRSGSRQSLKEFNRDIKKKVAETQDQGFFNWGLNIEGNARQRVLIAKPKEANGGDA